MRTVAEWTSQNHWASSTENLLLVLTVLVTPKTDAHRIPMDAEYRRSKLKIEGAPLHGSRENFVLVNSDTSNGNVPVDQTMWPVLDLVQR